MTIDYDVPRTSDFGQDADEPLQQLKKDTDGAAESLDPGEQELDFGYKLADIELSGEDLMVRIIPQQADEFVCTSCFLVHHRSNLAELGNGNRVCCDCV